MYALEDTLLVDADVLKMLWCKKCDVSLRYAEEFVSDCSRMPYDDGGVGC